jgi:hypothetical protein
MKLLNCLTVVCILAIAQNCKSQTNALLNVNNVHSVFNAAGDLYSSPPVFSNSILAPSSNPAPLFSLGQLWIGGLDQMGQLHIAAQNYRQTGSDFWPGPLDTVTAMIDSVASSSQWNRVWEISKSTIDSFRLGLFTQVPTSILDWPAHGDPAYGQAFNLAPFSDQNQNGIYEPAFGDFPLIRGDEAVYFIYNDHLENAAHSNSGGTPLGVEIHGMAYAFNCQTDSVLMNTIFIHYTFINRSTFDYSNCFVGHWLDIDLSMNDLVGSDSINNLFYYYGTGSDAIGFTFLNKPMTNTMTYSNNFTTIGNPLTANQHYIYMASYFADSTHLTYGGSGYGGNSFVDHAFTGDPFTGAGWVDSLVAMPNDKRGLGSYGNFALPAGDTLILDLALIHARDYSGSNPYYSTQILRNRAHLLQQYYDGDSAICGSLTSNHIDVLQLAPIRIYPNPSSDQIQVEYSPESWQSSQLEIVGMNGKTVASYQLSPQQYVHTIRIADLSNGIYMLRLIEDGEQVASERLVITRD